MVRWGKFVELAHDDVLLVALGLLEPLSMLSLAAASASTSTRLAGAGDHFGSAAQRFAAAHLGGAVVAEATAAAAAAAEAAAAEGAADGAEDGATETPLLAAQCPVADAAAPGPPVPRPGAVGAPPGARAAKAESLGQLAVLRALAAAAPAAEALRLALALASRPACDQAAVEDARRFLEALFRSEVRRLGKHQKRGAGAATNAAADAALTLLLAGDGGLNVVQAAARAVRESEAELDAQLEEGAAANIHRVYDGVARKRSAVEFLRGRLGLGAAAPGLLGTGACRPGSELRALARLEFDSAVSELDDTIVGYSREGYELACPKLTCGMQAGVLPYAHWWVFIGRGHAQGWAVLAR